MTDKLKNIIEKETKNFEWNTWADMDSAEADVESIKKLIYQIARKYADQQKEKIRKSGYLSPNIYGQMGYWVPDESLKQKS